MVYWTNLTRNPALIQLCLKRTESQQLKSQVNCLLCQWRHDVWHLYMWHLYVWRQIAWQHFLIAGTSYLTRTRIRCDWHNFFLTAHVLYSTYRQFFQSNFQAYLHIWMFPHGEWRCGPWTSVKRGAKTCIFLNKLFPE